MALVMLLPMLVGSVAVQSDIPEETISLQELIALPEKNLAKVDIAAMNLACAEGLPGSGHIDRKALLARLDAWAWLVGHETARHRHRFEQNPAKYNDAYGKFAMLVMASVLQKNLGVHYNPDQITSVDDPSGFDFTRSPDLFINGMLEGGGGTCSSMPVLYVAVGRRLGYPLRLVTTADHVFLRWDDPDTGERFNIEGTSRGFVSHPDEDYKIWPRPWQDVERDSGYFLTSLTPGEELSTFITTRGDCLFHSGFPADAFRMYKTAVELAPRNVIARVSLGKTARLMEIIAQEAKIEAVIRRQERRLRTDPRVMIPGMPSMPSAYPNRVNVHPPPDMSLVFPPPAPNPFMSDPPAVVNLRDLFNQVPQMPGALELSRGAPDLHERRRREAQWPFAPPVPFPAQPGIPSPFPSHRQPGARR